MSASRARRLLLLLTPLALTVAAVAVPLATANHGAPQLVTPNTPTAQFTTSISLDGSRIYFETPDALSADDGDTAVDVYQRVLSTGVVTLVSDRVRSGADEALDAAFGGASADGSRVFFRTGEQIHDEDDDASQDVYERFAGATTLLTDPAEPAVGQALDVNGAAFSRDGTSYFFTTTEALVPAEDTDAAQDLYLRKGGTTRLISDRVQDSSDAALAAAANGGAAGLSDDASRILFTTNEQLVDADDDAVSDLYLHDVTSSTTTLVSDRRQDTADEAKATGFTARMTPDGSRIYFHTTEALLAEDTDGVADDVYQFVLASGVTTMVSDHPTPGADIGKGAILSASAGMSRPATADGSRVVFLTQESLVPEDTDENLCIAGSGCLDVYVRENGTTTTILSDDDDANPDESAAASPQAVSPDGTRVIFTHFESLVPEDTDSVQDVYLREGGVTTLLTDSQQPGHTDSNSTPGISAALANKEVTRVFFRPPTEALVAADTDSSQDVYERAAGVTTLLSDRQQGGADQETTINSQTHSEDGSQVIFNTAEPLIAEDTDAVLDAYWSSGGPLPTEPTPTDPDPTDPGPTDPGPTDPGPTDPGPLAPPVLPGVTPPGPLSSCTPSTGFKSVSVKPARRGLAFKLVLSQKRRFTVEIFQRSQGRDIKTRRVARMVRKAGKPKHAFKWNGRGAKSDGFYVVRLSMPLPGRPDLRQLVFQRRARKFAARPAHTLRDTCDVLRAFRLSSPVFGGKKARALEISYVLGGASDVEISARRGTAVAFSLPKARRPGGQNLKVPLPAKGLKRGLYKVTIRITRGAQVTTGTITARLL